MRADQFINRSYLVTVLYLILFGFHFDALAQTDPRPCTDLTQIQGTVIEFGRTGGTTQPFSFTIAADGKIAAQGNTIVAKIDHIAPTTVKALLKLANVENFWVLPEVNNQSLNPDIAAQHIEIVLPCTKRRVEARGGTSGGPFAELYQLLTELVQAQ
jgi:hypothetical protein